MERYQDAQQILYPWDRVAAQLLAVFVSSHASLPSLRESISIREC